MVSQIAVSNATLKLQPGTALGVHGASDTSGLMLLNGGSIVSEGSGSNLTKIVRYNLVQEQATTNWAAPSVGRLISTAFPYGTNLLLTELRLRFTSLSTPAGGNDLLFLGATNLSVGMRDCEFYGGKVRLWEPNVGFEFDLGRCLG